MLLDLKDKQKKIGGEIRIMNNELRIKSFLVLVITLALGFFVNPVMAHVTVKPAEVGVGKYQTFNVSVPNEKQVATTGVRLVIPAGLEHVSPNVKPGWNVRIVKAGESMKGPVLNTGEVAPDPETVTEIVWTGGSIPEGQRDDFFFSAKTPADAGELKWMAYQTYADGVTVAWDLDKNAQPKDASGVDDFSASGPYSVTKVVNDLVEATPNPGEIKAADMQSGNLPLMLSVVAIIVSGFAIGISLRKG